jgi:ribonuclease BN (tRNA processing enzyme)
MIMSKKLHSPHTSLIGASLAASLFVALSLSAVAAPALAQAAPTNEAATVIVTLGTAGGPRPRADRTQSSNLLIANGTPYLIDVGSNAVRRLQQSGTSFLKVGQVFITHEHSDHVMGLPAFLSTAWEFQRREPITIYGPPGTNQLVRDTLQFLSGNEEIRRHEGYPTPIANIVKSVEVQPGAIYSDANVQVFAAQNTHFNFAVDSPTNAHFKSYSYKFVTLTKSVVFTGDTGPSTALEKLAAGVDDLVTEVNDPEELVALYKKNGAWQAKTEVEKRDWLRHQNEEHLSPEAVGALAAKAHVKRVILTHLTPVTDEKTVYPDFVRRVKKIYDGEVLLAADLKRF